jgi:hypothetical protein
LVRNEAHLPPPQHREKPAVVNQPSWWDWELELTPHLEKRMEDRGFTEVDLRLMVRDAHNLRAGAQPGRFVVECSFRGRLWHVIVELDTEEQLIVVVTAYGVEE